MKLNYNVRIVIRKDKERSDGTCPLYVKTTLNGKPLVKLSMGESVKKEDWDSKNQKAIGKGYSLFNKHLHQSILEIENFIGEMKSRGKIITKEQIVNLFKKEDTECYYKYFDEVFCKSRLNDLSESTKNKYLLLRRRLKEFRPQLRLSEIDLKFLIGFRNFLIYDKELGKGAKWNTEKNFRATVKLAYDLGMIDNYAFRQFKLEKPKCKSEALNLDELNRIVEVDLNGKKRLEDIRDKFLFACYTGLRFGDVKNLKWEAINDEGVLKIVQEKTKNPVSVPLKSEAKEIIAKYEKDKDERETVFKVVSNQKTNYTLKDIAELAKVEKNITFHMARHTFGTVLAITENAYTIAKLMGHKKISTSMIYVNTDETALKERMKNVSFR